MRAVVDVSEVVMLELAMYSGGVVVDIAGVLGASEPRC